MDTRLFIGFQSRYRFVSLRLLFNEVSDTDFFVRLGLPEEKMLHSGPKLTNTLHLRLFNNKFQTLVERCRLVVLVNPSSMLISPPLLEDGAGK